MKNTFEKNLQRVAEKYVTDNPPVSEKFLLTSRQGFKRNHDYRYLLKIEEQVKTVENHQFVYLKSFLTRESVGKTAFYINPQSPTQVYLNGQLVYKSSLLEEGQPAASQKFTCETQLMNELVLCFEKTNTGMGAEFGPARVKGDPFFVWENPTEKVEGWQVSKIYQQKVAAESFSQLEFKAVSIPKITSKVWLPESIPAKIFAKTKFYLPADKKIVIDGLLASTEIFIDGKKGLDQLLIKGEHQLLLKIVDINEDLRKFSLSGADIQSVFSLENPWALVGPFSLKQEISLDDLFSQTQVIKQTYWQVGSPEYYVRPYITSPLFGRWNYPLGVTLNGLFNYSQYFQDENIFSYVVSHLQFCGQYYKYSLWDKKTYGAPLLNYSLAMIDSLDDCGSMAYTLMRVNKVQEIVGSQKIFQDVTDYILQTQARLPDGTLYREKSHSALMENTLWADDIYMSLPYLTEYYLKTQEKRVLFDILRQFKNYFHLLYRPEKNLLAHVYDFPYHTHTDVSWGRGNGWYFLSLVIAIESLKETEIYPDLLVIFQKLAPTYASHLGEDLFWHQILDDQTTYPETSVTAIMLFTFAKSLQLDLTENTLLSAEKLRACFIHLQEKMVDEKANLLGVCRGSGFSFTEEYYALRLLPRVNDTHGIGIYLTSGVEILKSEAAYEQ